MIKKLHIYVSILFCTNLVSQNAIKYDNDAGGNMIQRYIQVVSMRMKKTEKDSVLNFNVYPNPTKNQITIEGVIDFNKKEALVFLYNINGNLVRQDTYYGIKKSFNLSGLSAGLYILTINFSERQSSNYRIIITE